MDTAVQGSQGSESASQAVSHTIEMRWMLLQLPADYRMKVVSNNSIGLPKSAARDRQQDKVR